MAIPDTIYGLSSEDYHFEEPYREYLSSSALKYYLKSPKLARFAMDNPSEEEVRRTAIWLVVSRSYGVHDAYQWNVDTRI